MVAALAVKRATATGLAKTACVGCPRIDADDLHMSDCRPGPRLTAEEIHDKMQSKKSCQRCNSNHNRNDCDEPDTSSPVSHLNITTRLSRVMICDYSVCPRPAFYRVCFRQIGAG